MVSWGLFNFKQVYKNKESIRKKEETQLWLCLGEYMIVITGYQRVGTLMQNCDILRATAFQILPISRNTNGLSSQQLDDEQTFINLLQKHLKKNGFYFSYKYNLTLSVQKQAQVEGDVNNWREVRA